MRHYGFIKSFGKYDRYQDREQDYGFIARDGQPDIFFHRKHTTCSGRELDEGAAVTFEVVANPRNGKEEARRVCPLNRETDVQVLTAAAHSGENTIRLQAAPKWLATQPIEVQVREAIQFCSMFSSADRRFFVSALPDTVLLQERKLRDHLPPGKRFDICCRLVKETEPLTTTVHEELIEAVYSVIDGKDWNAARESSVALLPLGTEIVQVIRSIKPPSYLKRGPYISHIPIEFFQKFPLFRSLITRATLDEAIPVLVKLLQDKHCWEEKPEGAIAELLWRDAPSQRKLYCIYYVAKERLELPNLERLRTDDFLINAALSLLWARDHAGSRIKAFDRAHTLIQDWVTEQAWISTNHLDLSPMLPECRQGYISVSYCEARPWQDNSVAFCPRARSGCCIEGAERIKMRPRYATGHYRPWKEGQRRRDKGYLIASTSIVVDGKACFDVTQLNGARLYPDCTKSWMDWSLLELIKASDVTPNIPDQLRSPTEYVPKLAGWINRLNEIRARLKCSTCSQIMAPNYKYARHLARYNSTIVSCHQGAGHDHNIYLNHCWACREIVDSREATIRVGEFYLCLHCGSGPMRSDTYQQGSICPKCGTHEMIGSGRVRTCGTCNHTIRLPAYHQITGTNSTFPSADVDDVYDAIDEGFLE